MGVRISPGVPLKNGNIMSNLEEIFGQRAIEIIKKTPNDMELGEKVRRLYLSTLNNEQHETKKGNDSCVCGRQASGEDC